MINTWNPAEISDKLNQLEGQIQANDVIANPTGEATETLTKIGIDGDIYSFTATVEADDIPYDNTASGLTADDVQDAIDELRTAIGNIPVVKKTTKSGSTTAAGMLNISDMDPTNILTISAPSGTNAYCLWREQSTAGRTTVLVLDGSLQPIASTEITLNVTYI